MKRFPSKILLFGEYGLVAGGSGLALPYPRYGGLFTKKDGQTAALMEESKRNLKRLLAFLQFRSSDFSFLDLPRMESDFNEGWWFDSNIPGAYGLGSSGALVAALYHRYVVEQAASLTTTRQQLASIESFFHGSSSGTDPLVSLLQTPVLLQSDGSIEALEAWNAETMKAKIFLVDTGDKSKTLSLVEWFKAQLQKPAFRAVTEKEMLDVNDRIIAAIQQGKAFDIDQLKSLSRYQNDYLYPMIPESFHQHFMAGFMSNEFFFKLCGSGGGGFMLCFAIDEQAAINYFETKGLTYQPLFSS